MKILTCFLFLFLTDSSKQRTRLRSKISSERADLKRTISIHVRLEDIESGHFPWKKDSADRGSIRLADLSRNSRGGWQLNLNILIRCLEQLEDSLLSLFKSAFNRICGLVRDYLSVPFLTIRERWRVQQTN